MLGHKTKVTENILLKQLSTKLKDKTALLVEKIEVLEQKNSTYADGLKTKTLTQIRTSGM